jgi:hypothetical protein
MNSKIRSKLLTLALCGAALAGCNAIEDERTEPFTPVPAEGVVLQGTVSGPLGSRRAVALINNGDINSTVSVTATVGTAFTPFTFGVKPAGTSYNITVRTQPFGKICTVTNGQGTISAGSPPNVLVNCVNDPNVTRYAVRVAVPADFGGRAGAKVILTTEEGVFEQTPANGATSVTFPSAVFNNVVGGTVWGSNTPVGTTTAPASTANGGINPYTNIVGGTINLPTFSWTVTATTTEGSTPERPVVNRCNVSAGTNFTGTGSGSPAGALFTNVAMPPVANIGFGTNTSQIPTVNACSFTIGGSVFYANPPQAGSVAQAMPAGGLDLQLRDVQGNVIETLTFTGGYGSSSLPSQAPGAGVATQGVAYNFPTPKTSNSAAVYDVAVSRQPTGQTCIVANGGAATLGVSQTNITSSNVACRAIPAVANRLRGTYNFYNGLVYNYPSPTSTAVSTNSVVINPDGSLTTTTVAVTTFNTETNYGARLSPGLGGESQSQIVTSNISTRTTVVTRPPGGALVTSTDETVASTPVTNNNIITRNFLTFFEDGTFLHGAHGNANNQVEHGFYQWNPTGGPGGTGLLSFTFVSDTAATVANAQFVQVTYLSGLVNTALSGTAGATAPTTTALGAATMSGVVRDSLNSRGRITGVFFASGAVSGVPFGFGTKTPGSRWAGWTLVEPKNTDGQLEGPWVTRDHRRAWSYDNNTTLGMHTGVNGGASNLQDGCFTFEDFRATSGFYTRRGGITGCLDALTFPAGIGTIDIPSTTVGTPNNLNQLPGFVGRMPGSETAFDGRSPSPIYYAIGSAATLATIADPVFFPPAEVSPAALSWCVNAAGTGPGEVYAVRSSLNGAPINKPVYFCRERTN